MNLVEEKGFVTDGHFFLVSCLDGFDELVLPAVQLDAFDVLKRFVDVEHTLLVLGLLLGAYIFSTLASQIAVKNLREREDYYNNSAPAELIDDCVRCDDQMERAFEEIGATPDKSPNSAGFVHDDASDLTRGEIFICGGCHAEILSK